MSAPTVCTGCDHLHDALKLALTPQRAPIAPWVLSALLAGMGFGMLFGPGILKAVKP